MARRRRQKRGHSKTKRVVQSAVRPRQGDDEAPARKAGVMLVRLADGAARSKAQGLRFSITNDPLDFVAKVVRVLAAVGKGHVVLAHAIGTDFAVTARIAAALLGCFLTTPEVFCQDAPRGIMYREA